MQAEQFIGKGTWFFQFAHLVQKNRYLSSYHHHVSSILLVYPESLEEWKRMAKQIGQNVNH